VFPYQLTLYRQQKPNRYIYLIDDDKFKNVLSEQQWTEVYSSKKANDSYTAFHKIIPKKLTAKNIKLKDWMTAGLLCSTRTKQYLFLKCKKNPNNKKLTQIYKKYKNNYTSILRAVKVKFYENKFISVSNNPKLTWQHVNEITDNKTINKETIRTIVNNDRTYNVNEDSKGMSNIYNQYFISVGKKLDESSNFDYEKYPPKNYKSLSFNNLFCIEIETEDVINLVNSGKDDTAPGYDRIMMKLLKYVIDFIKNPLVYIYNLSIQQGIFPDLLKLAVIKPIFKEEIRNKLIIIDQSPY
jgi:hypothetical protein